jgi:hypothetical protein
MEVHSNFDLLSDHTPVIGTISNTVINVNKVPRLHNKRTDCQTYKKLIEDKLNLKISLKTSEELEKETENFIRIPQEAAKQAAPPPIQKLTKNIPLENKKVIRAKRKARRKWQHSHNPEDKTTYNRLTIRFKKKLKEAQNASFYDYVINLNRHKILYGDQLNQLPNHCQLILRSESNLPLQYRGQEATKRRLTRLPSTLQKFLHPMTIYTTRK